MSLNSITLSMMVIATFIFMRLSGIECTLKEVKQRRYESQNQILQIPFTVNLTDDKCNFVDAKSEELKDRKNGIDTKARTLLTLTSLILGLSSSTTGIASAKSVGSLSIFPLIFLFITIFLLVRYFSIDKNYSVDYSYLSTTNKSAKKSLYNEIIECQHYNNLVADFLVDLYRSALRYFIIGMLFIMTLGIWNILSINNNLLKNKHNDFISIPQIKELKFQKLFNKDRHKSKNAKKDSTNFIPSENANLAPKIKLVEP